MVFGILKDMANIAGEVVGTVAGVPLALIAETLEVPLEFVKSAKDAGCETVDEIREWINDNR
jgi:hypothetical protein